jgi:hypothetical protein
MSALTDLDDAKRRFLAAKSDMDRLRQQIAEDICPLSVGDKITVTDGSRTFEAEVEKIRPNIALMDHIEPELGVAPGWAVDCRRINKGTGLPGKWGCCVTDEAKLQDGAWHLPERGIEAMLGLARTNTP